MPAPSLSDSTLCAVEWVYRGNTATSDLACLDSDILAPLAAILITKLFSSDDGKVIDNLGIQNILQDLFPGLGRERAIRLARKLVLDGYIRGEGKSRQGRKIRLPQALSRLVIAVDIERPKCLTLAERLHTEWAEAVYDGDLPELDETEQRLIQVLADYVVARTGKTDVLRGLVRELRTRLSRAV